MDLKPANVFYSEAQGYRIGDIGFASLASLPYSSLPVQYRSTYTAPELLDEMAVLNSTVDVYALGLILYQAYNGGVLPNIAPGTLLPTPSYADYELAEKEGVKKEDLPEIIQNNMKELNKQLAAYQRLAEVVLYPKEFEKTPKRSIKRYLYDTQLLDRLNRQ